MIDFGCKKLLITGGTGSFGKTMLKHALEMGFGSIRILSRDELKQNDLRLNINSSKVEFFLGDVRDKDSVLAASKNVHYIFHAAALKQVPSCEFFPLEAVKTNILGAANVCDAAIQNGVAKLVVLSTDKAVYPINAMGLTKGLMEKVMISKAREIQGSDTIMCATRYGNVMGSRGSVIPLFVKQIKAGKPVTITNQHMTRFLMGLAESVDLVKFAFENANNGDIFVRKAPSSTMGDLATALFELLDREKNITHIGTRHGEKLFETLLSTEEFRVSEDLGDYFKVPADIRDLNYDKYFAVGEEINEVEVSFNSHNAELLSVEEIKKLLIKDIHVREIIRA